MDMGREDDAAALIAGREVRFDLDPVWQQKLVNGWDDIDLTAQYDDATKKFRADRMAAYPWAMPAS